LLLIIIGNWDKKTQQKRKMATGKLHLGANEAKKHKTGNRSKSS